MKKENALFLCLLYLISIKYGSAQTEIGSNTYDLALSKVFTFNNHSEKIGIKTSDLHIGKHHQAMAKVDMHIEALFLAGDSWSPYAPFLFGFSTVKEPPLPNYATDYQNISTGKASRMTFKCEDPSEQGCVGFSTKKYDSNDIQIFKKMLVRVVKQIHLAKDGGFTNLKDMMLKTRVTLERHNTWPGLIKSIRLPGVDEITDLTPFVDTEKITIYPNPSSNGIFTMDFYTHTAIDISFILNNIFETIIEKTLSNLDPGRHTFQINPSEPLPPGTYHLNGIIGTKPFFRTLIVSGE